jgi:hypothetical protein
MIINLSARWGVGEGGADGRRNTIYIIFKGSTAITEISDTHHRPVLEIKNHLEPGSASKTLCIV